MEQVVQAPETGTETLEQKPIKRKRKAGKKLKKRWIVLGVLVLAVAVVFAMCNSASQNAMNSLLTLDDTTVIEAMDLTYSISATGTVVSAETQNVYSTQSYTVQEVFVKVGDFVQEGDALCKLDSKALEDQIAKKEISVGVSAKSAAQQVKTARDAYNANKSAYDEGLNASMISSQSQVTNAFNAWEKAKKTYDDYRTTLDLGENSQILQLEASVTNAGNALDSARDAYNTARSDSRTAYNAWTTYKNSIQVPDQTALDAADRAVTDAKSALQTAQASYESAKTAYQLAFDDYNNGVTPTLTELTNAEIVLNAATTLFDQATSDLVQKQQIYNTLNQQTGKTDTKEQQLKADYNAKQAVEDSRQTTYDNAQASYDSAVKQLNAAYRSTDSTLADYIKNIDTAYESYVTALNSLSAAEKTAETQLQANKNSLASSEISAINDLPLLELAQMQEDLEKTTVLATKTGTITAVYAKVGNSGSGLLAIIEDTDKLKVDTTVKEYDIGTVRVGQKVTIKSDATGDAVIEGVIENISPASKKTAAGAIDTASDVVFPTDVVVTQKDTGLRIGMSVRLNYIIEHKQETLGIPFEAVYTNGAGATCVLIVKDQGDGTFLIEELPVTTGMETDLNIEVSGEGVVPGLRVINTAENYRALIGQSLPMAEQRASGGGTGMPFMMAARGG